MRARITTTGMPTLGDPIGHIELDGHDITRAVQDVNLSLSCSQVPILELGLAVYETMRFDGEVDVLIPESVREALIQLGWTPPEHDPEHPAVEGQQ